MEFTPDVIVRDPDSRGITLVAEAKGEQTDVAKAESQLKWYMLRMHCSVGLIMTPSRLRIYKDKFLNRSEDSIGLVADFPSESILRFDIPRTRDAHSVLESALVDWLDRLSHTGHAQSGDDELNTAISQYILPAVVGGAVSIAHPSSQ